MGVTGKIAVLFLLIMVGFASRKLKLVSDTLAHEISRLIVNVTLPIFLITSMNFSFSKEVLGKSIWLIIISFCVYMAAIMLSYVYIKLIRADEADRDVYQYVSIFANVGFMGYPVLHVVLGEIGVFYGAVFNIAFSVFVWTYGVFLLTRNKGSRVDLKKVLNPSLVGIMIGFVLFLTDAVLPAAMDETLNLIGATTTPLSMMAIGYMLTDVRPRELISDHRLYVTSLYRLVLFPAALFTVLYAIGLREYLLIVPVIIFGMPAAVNTAIIASRYGNNYKLASKLVFVSTLMSIITLPILIRLVVNYL